MLKDINIFRIKRFFYTIVELCITNTDIEPNPCQALIEQLVIYHEHFMLGFKELGPGESREFRLNHSGFKMYWTRQYDGSITFSLGGDQVNMYPKFVNHVNNIIDNFAYREVI